MGIAAPFIGLGVFLIIVLIIGLSQKKGTKKLAEKGLIMKRPRSYYEKKNIFSTVSTYEQICAEVAKGNYQPSGLKFQVGYGGKRIIAFDYNKYWTALLEYIGEKDGKNQFCFNFESWRTYNGAPYYEDNMNMLLTSIEKIFLSLDSSTTVETHEMQLKTK